MGQMAAQVRELSLVLLLVSRGSVKAVGERSEGPKTRTAIRYLRLHAELTSKQSHK